MYTCELFLWNGLKKVMVCVMAIFIQTTSSACQISQSDFPVLNGQYLGQKPPGLNPELFAEGIVSVGEGVHGNIVFAPDFSEAAWHPNFKVNGKSLIYIMKYRDGKWEYPIEFFPKEGYGVSEPFYSCDGKRFYYLAGESGQSGNAENDRIWFVERYTDGLSEPKPVECHADSIRLHWQFSLDKNENLYFGGSSSDKQGEIYFSKFQDGKYLSPERLPSTINTGSGEFSPFISPDNNYIVFTRLLEQKNAPPKMNLFVSFKDTSGTWSEAQNVTERIELPVNSPYIMMSQPRISPDGKYLFFTFFNGKGHMVYWVDAKIIEDVRSGK